MPGVYFYLMREDTSTLIYNIKESMWLVPALLVLAAVLLAPTMVYLDEVFGDAAQEWIPFVFAGGSDGARDMLSTIATAMASVIGIAFSITIVVLQLAASQFSPRVITTFRRDRGQQMVLGMYLATFVYSLLVLRRVRASNEAEEAFVPGLAMLVALILALVCLGLLLYFVQHISQQLLVSEITTRIRSDLDNVSETLYPEDVGQPFDESTTDEDLIAEIEDRATSRMIIRAPEGGYLQTIRESRLAEFVEDPVLAIQVEFSVGSYLFEREVLATVFLTDAISRDEASELAELGEKAFSFGSSPSLRANSQLAVQQLVDVALRALSTGVNDPSTARQVLEELSDWLALTAHRDFPSRVRNVDDGVLVLPQVGFDDYVYQTFGQIRHAVAVGANLLHTIAEMLEKLLATDPPRNRLKAFGDELRALKEETDKISNPIARKRLEERVDALLEDIDSRMHSTAPTPS